MQSQPVETLAKDEDGELVCMHRDAYVEEACCPSGTRDCGCYGSDSLLCPNPNCTGITDTDAERLWPELRGW